MSTVLEYLFVYVVLLLASFPAGAQSYMPINPKAEYFRTLASSGGGTCCNGFDGHPPQDVETDVSNDGTHYRVKIEDQWVDVPEDRVVKEPNRYGYPVVWYTTDWLSAENPTTAEQFRGVTGQRKKFNIRCFLPGALF
jgi:hypothetical protein